ncbi:ATP synthase F1, delta subunit [Parvibaculum lavamentivorans DS-1]|uniref:ATP synthase subunit delta n=1 Tax=Parvibaculum lavamentivorans (strain DS-1 / DSM 13023 / NCIMB 13966) TaxID=402881 RepID=ATPD_PARL1|nr:F0F1 ATP synthase subunit delta [Parvibaculum lavamentivorans]A7HT49.1 RecName: Full=ATP synthase subunit delta; AltName: Full=ATP synthase F(1) sector subunit delta; AltName: Full=F-type ATPase subunit delta; Short=F-ATPase subunit delta [Parvibaculum lavamentivorans DS-1]ABS63082.1 ATP synthase F1, delta subunit [Parvibaculum lavamentivorans DS-1]
MSKDRRAPHVSSDHPVSGVAGRYATALFELADAEGALDAVAGDLERISAMLNESSDLVRLVRSPIFSAEDQTKAFGAVLEKAGISGLVKNFIGLVIRNRRLFGLSDMIGAYTTLLARKRGEMTADVVSAHPLQAAQVESLKAALKSATGRDVRINTKVDASLLGGLIVTVGSRMVDSSLRTKLNSLKIAMKEAS